MRVYLNFVTANKTSRTWQKGRRQRNHRSVTAAGDLGFLMAGLGGGGGGVFFDADEILGLGATAGFGLAPPPPPFVRFVRGDGAG